MRILNREPPPAGIMDVLKGEMSGPDRFRTWLLLHAVIPQIRDLAFRRMVIDSCLPDPEGDLEFQAVEELHGL